MPVITARLTGHNARRWSGIIGARVVLWKPGIHVSFLMNTLSMVPRRFPNPFRRHSKIHRCVGAHKRIKSPSIRDSCSWASAACCSRSWNRRSAESDVLAAGGWTFSSPAPFVPGSARICADCSPAPEEPTSADATMLATEKRERYYGARRKNNLDLFLNTHGRRVGKTSPSCYQSESTV